MYESSVSAILAQIPSWKKFMTVDYVARLLDVDRRTVRRYIERGKLDAFGLPGEENRVGVYRISKKNLEDFLLTYSVGERYSL